VARLHVLDSLAAVPLLRERGIKEIVDLGSGGGYPGIPLAVALPARGVLVESVGKKARFLSAVVQAVGRVDRLSVAAIRAEVLAGEPPRRAATAVVARAVAPLAELVELALPLLVPGGRLVAWKRGDIAAELDAARWAARALGGGVPLVHPVPLGALEGHVLVEVEKRRPSPPGYPRDPGVRRRRPWGSGLC
jgi:16S rRNA (guanine527-N7)-methyltransferase